MDIQSKKHEKDGDKMDALTENAMNTCEPATDKELTDVIWDIPQGFLGQSNRLKRITHKISASCIPWSSITTLSILGNADSRCNDTLREAGMRHGIYINLTSDRLILIHPSKDSLPQYAKRLGSQLKALELHNIPLPHLDITSFPALQRF